MTSGFPMNFGLKVSWPLGKTEFILCQMLHNKLSSVVNSLANIGYGLFSNSILCVCRTLVKSA